MTTVRAEAWRLFDEIVRAAPAAGVNPWRAGESGVASFDPDYDTLRRLLAVPAALEATSQSGVPALALDVWLSFELRRAGFETDQVWPRPTAPRVLSGEVQRFVAALPERLREQVQPYVQRGPGGGRAAANILGKHYVKQVDVVMSAWATGPELMISTKRMDSSFGKNAANRVEESYGDARNLRARHPRAALGFLYCLGARALEDEPDIARWLIDLLGKLGREADAYDAVGLVVPEVMAAAPDATSEEDPAGPLDPGPADEADAADEGRPEEAITPPASLPPVTLHYGAVPGGLDPGCFLATMGNLVLDRTPINFHAEARARRRSALA